MPCGHRLRRLICGTRELRHRGEQGVRGEHGKEATVAHLCLAGLLEREEVGEKWVAGLEAEGEGAVGMGMLLERVSFGCQLFVLYAT